MSVSYHRGLSILRLFNKVVQNTQVTDGPQRGGQARPNPLQYDQQQGKVSCNTQSTAFRPTLQNKPEMENDIKTLKGGKKVIIINTIYLMSISSSYPDYYSHNKLKS